MLSTEQRDALRSSFRSGILRVQSVSPAGTVEWKRVLAVQRAETGQESICEVLTEGGPMILTGGHRVFTTPTTKTEAEVLQVGQTVLSVIEEHPALLTVLASRRLPDREYMYDLTAEDWHNFVLYRSGTTISNSPDRNYHFRPPTHEGTIGCFNQVFGYIWEDEELLEYLNISLDKWNMQPPETEELGSLDMVCSRKPAWKAALLWGAVVHAAMALSFNWVADEFSITGDTLVRVFLPDGREVDIPVKDLYGICHG